MIGAPVDGPIAPRAARVAADNVAPQVRSPGSRVAEGIVRCGISAGIAYTVGSRLGGYTDRIASLANQACSSLSKLNFLSLYNEKMSKKLTCYNPNTCFNACTRAIDGTSNGIEASTCKPIAISQEIFKNAYYAVLPKNTECSFPKACLETCTSALNPWSHAHKVELATNLAWTSYLLPVIQASALAATADTVLGAVGLEGNFASESARWAIGTAITAAATTTVVEAAVIYTAYRTGYTVLSHLFGSSGQAAQQPA
jgi:hypothetical protein